MVHKVLLWTGLGLAVRFWQLGLEMRPFFNRHSFWVYPVYGGIGGSFGYWLMGVEQRQMEYLAGRREQLLEKRRRRADVLAAHGFAVDQEDGSIRDVSGGGREGEQNGGKVSFDLPLTPSGGVANVEGEGETTAEA